MSGTLVLVRHGQSDWNLKNLFTGWKDPDLTELGIEEANAGGKALADYGIKFDIAFTSVLTRAQNTLKLILDDVGQPDLETIRDQALNERDYGDLSGLNKDDARAKWGEEQVHIWRRSYDVPPPGGESLQRHRRPRLALLHDRNPAARAARREGAGRRARQFAALAGDGARPADRGTDPRAQPRDRRADGLQAQGRFHRRFQGSARATCPARTERVWRSKLRKPPQGGFLRFSCGS